MSTILLSSLFQQNKAAKAKELCCLYLRRQCPKFEVLFLLQILILFISERHV